MNQNFLKVNTYFRYIEMIRFLSLSIRKLKDRSRQVVKLVIMGRSHMIFNINSVYGDLEDKRILDLGVGGGILSIGCALLGCRYFLIFISILIKESVE